MRALGLVVVALVFVPVAARAQSTSPSTSPAPSVITPPAPSRAAIEHMLSGFEDTPTLDQIRALGEGAIPILVALHDDESVIQPVRLRAVEAMGAFSGDAARRFLVRVMHDPHEPGVVVREAAEALAQSQGASAVPEISRLLSSSDRNVREGAIEALASIGNDAALRRLAVHQVHEADGALRDRITALVAH
jgi:HEAT repeat protein